MLTTPISGLSSSTATRFAAATASYANFATCVRKTIQSINRIDAAGRKDIND